MGKGGTVNRLEPEGLIFCDWNVGVWFRVAGWYEFKKKFSGENYGVSRTFFLSFDGVQVQLGTLKFEVTKKSIARALFLPQTGECWYKGLAFDAIYLNFFVKFEHHNPVWKNGVPKDWMKEEWHKVLLVVLRYITCEGRFNTTHILHMRFLYHISGYKDINLSYFLHTDLLKMSKKIQSNPNSPPHHVFHARLIKILVKFELDRKIKSWDTFIKEVGFVQLTQKKNIGIPIKPLRSVPGSQAPPSQKIVIEQQDSLNPSSSNFEFIPKRRVPFPRKKEVLKGPVPSSSGIK